MADVSAAPLKVSKYEEEGTRDEEEVAPLCDCEAGDTIACTGEGKHTPWPVPFFVRAETVTRDKITGTVLAGRPLATEQLRFFWQDGFKRVSGYVAVPGRNLGFKADVGVTTALVRVDMRACRALGIRVALADVHGISDSCASCISDSLYRKVRDREDEELTSVTAYASVLGPATVREIVAVDEDAVLPPWERMKARKKRLRAAAVALLQRAPGDTVRVPCTNATLP